MRFNEDRGSIFYDNFYSNTAVIIITSLLIFLSTLEIAWSILVLAKKTPTTIRKIVAAVIAVLLAIALCLVTILPSMSHLNQPLYGNGLPKNRNINWGDSYDSVKKELDGALNVFSEETDDKANYFIREMRQDFWRTGVPAEIQYIFGKDDQYLKNIKISLRCTNRGSFEKLESKLLMKMEEQFGPSDGLISGKGNTRGYKGYRWQKDGTRLSMLMSSNQQTEFDFFGQEHKYYEIILVIRPQN